MDEPLSSPPPEEKSSGPWLGLGIGFVLIVIVIGFLIYSSRTSLNRAATQPKVIGATAQADPYAAKLQISGEQLSAADNMLGGTATYVEGTVTNGGDKTVTGANVEVTFKNSLGEVVQRENEPLWIVLSREPAIDVGTLAADPLKPGAQAEFRLSFERISKDWNQQAPELRITVVTTK
jgi:uncharacterized protein DUF2393